MITIETIGYTFEILGNVMIASIVLLVHHRVLNEQHIDKRVFKTMKREQWIGLIGILLIVFGYILQVPLTLS